MQPHLKVQSSHQEFYVLHLLQCMYKTPETLDTKDDNSKCTIIILCMPMVHKIVAISGVNHHDLYNMHNYMCSNMAGCLYFTMFHTTGYGGVHCIYVFDELQGQCQA